MKTLIIQFCIGVIALSSYMENGVSGQLYSAPVIRTSSDNDNELGVLLTVLLLASRNKGSSGNCGCCNCCGGGNIPIPYPIPIPTNNPIINTYRGYDDGYGDDDRGSAAISSSFSSATGGAGGAGGNAESEPEQNVYIVTNSGSYAANEVKSNSNAASSSGAASNSGNR
ncbi:unnamed protein product [Chilo suppressalis]|uniref:Uncharacterized protein n=1 Tax=Chilo suppressalis TaxID=168631 RepID=A0ABN8BAB5_CHISP|nr:unnamed protein product [Chilo suppressalis]